MGTIGNDFRKITPFFKVPKASQSSEKAEACMKVFSLSAEVFHPTVEKQKISPAEKSQKYAGCVSAIAG